MQATPSEPATRRLLSETLLLVRRVTVRDRLIELGAPEEPLTLATQGIDSALGEIASTTKRMQEIRKLEQAWLAEDDHESHRSTSDSMPADAWSTAREHQG